MTEDPRKAALKKGLRQLGTQDLTRLLQHMADGKPLLLDRDQHGCANYSIETGCYCPLAIALDIPALLDERFSFPTESSVRSAILEVLGPGGSIYNTRGVKGEFYTRHRWDDLRTAANEVYLEKRR